MKNYFNSNKVMILFLDIIGKIDLININKIINILNLSQFKKIKLNKLKFFHQKDLI